MNYTNTYLQHHGVKGMKWGVRRYENEDGTLTAAGRKRYYATRNDNPRIGRLNRRGYRYNKQLRKDFDKYTDTVKSRVYKDAEFKKAMNDYKSLNKKNSEFYITEREKWLNNKGEYKGKNYYQFKDIAFEKWSKTEDGKKEAAALNTMRERTETVAKGHEAYNKTYRQLKDLDFHSDNVNSTMSKSYGREAVCIILNDTYFMRG